MTAIPPTPAASTSTRTTSRDAGRGHQAAVQPAGALYAHDRRSVLVVPQATVPPADGVIKHVMTGLNPQGCTTAVQGTERAGPDHDFPAGQDLPERGDIAIFNRPHTRSAGARASEFCSASRRGGRRQEHLAGAFQIDPLFERYVGVTVRAQVLPTHLQQGSSATLLARLTSPAALVFSTTTSPSENSGTSTCMPMRYDPTPAARRRLWFVARRPQAVRPPGVANAPVEALEA